MGDGMLITLTLSEQIPSGKNQVIDRWFHGRKVKTPNKRFVDWRKQAAQEWALQIRKWSAQDRKQLPLRGRLGAIVAYSERMPVPAGGVRDVPGMMDALWHLLGYCEIVKNDGQIRIVQWTEVNELHSGNDKCCIWLEIYQCEDEK